MFTVLTSLWKLTKREESDRNYTWDFDFFSPSLSYDDRDDLRAHNSLLKLHKSQGWSLVAAAAV